MQLLDLNALTRSELDDTVEPYLWTDLDLMEYANDAELEACRRSRLLTDSTTPEITQIAVTAGQALIELDPRVLFVRRARFAGKRPLARKTMQDMEDWNPLWQDAAPAEPVVFVPDYETGKLLLSPVPIEDGVLLLSVVRDPLVEMNDEQDSPEIPPRYHRSLRHWMIFRAYSKQDSEGADPKKAANALALFEQEFGQKSSAIEEVWIQSQQFDHDGTF